VIRARPPSCIEESNALGRICLRTRRQERVDNCWIAALKYDEREGATSRRATRVHIGTAARQVAHAGNPPFMRRRLQDMQR
jgi:hypothetical protein